MLPTEPKMSMLKSRSNMPCKLPASASHRSGSKISAKSLSTTCSTEEDKRGATYLQNRPQTLRIRGGVNPILVPAAEVTPPCPQAVSHHAHAQPLPNPPQPEVARRRTPRSGRRRRPWHRRGKAEDVIHPCREVIVRDADPPECRDGRLDHPRRGPLPTVTSWPSWRLFE